MMMIVKLVSIVTMVNVNLAAEMILVVPLKILPSVRGEVVFLDAGM